MVANVITAAFQGIEAVPVTVQTQMSKGLTSFTIVGLADKAVAESRERVRAALFAIGLSLPPKRIIVNLAPADLPKEGSHYDLPIALTLLAASQIIPSDILNEYMVLGELGLDASIARINGVLPAAVSANAEKLGLICPKSCGSEAAWAGGNINIIAPDNLVQLINHFKGRQHINKPEPALLKTPTQQLDFADIRGQESAKRALEIAAAGGLNILMVGPPGCGKSMLAQRLPSILPPMNPIETLESSMIASIAGHLSHGRISPQRPFRNPHHSASQAAMTGGGHKAKPGEMALAHNGVLFLDELPEFQQKVLESLRQPMETGETIIARANHHVTYPARFQFVGAMNPCRCGYAGSPGYHCKRGKRCETDYWDKLSGPLLDRIDMHIEIPQLNVADLTLPPAKTGSAQMAQKVMQAREIQRKRYLNENIPNLYINAQLSGAMLEKYTKTDKEATTLLQSAAEHMNMSARAYHRTLKTARTIADLENAESITRHHIAEALGYRPKMTHLKQAA